MRQSTYEVHAHQDGDGDLFRQQVFVETARQGVTALLTLPSPPGTYPRSHHFHWWAEANRRADLLRSGKLGREAKREEAEGLIAELYFYGRSLGILLMDFTEFRLRAYGAKTGWAWEVRYPRPSPRGGWGAHGCPFRDGRSYRRAETHQPKAGPPSPRDCWRKEKAFGRDKAKSGGGSWRHGNSRKTFCKSLSARRHRRWARRHLAKGCWDAFHDREYIPFADPWMWD